MGKRLQNTRMTVQKLRDALMQRPFRAFTILVADGREYRVASPEMVSIAPKADRTFVVAHGDEEYTILDLLLVTGLASGDLQGRRMAS